MGAANCCHQKADKDLFGAQDYGKQRNYYDEVDHEATQERIGDELKVFE